MVTTRDTATNKFQPKTIIMFDTYTGQIFCECRLPIQHGYPCHHFLVLLPSNDEDHFQKYQLHPRCYASEDFNQVQVIRIAGGPSTSTNALSVICRQTAYERLGIQSTVGFWIWQQSSSKPYLFHQTHSRQWFSFDKWISVESHLQKNRWLHWNMVWIDISL